jgi:nucleolar protein 6
LTFCPTVSLFADLDFSLLAQPNISDKHKMSRDEGLSRKEKKAQRDAERKKSSKKRKREEVEEPDVPEKDASELQADFIPLDAGVDGVPKEKSKTKSSKKRKAEETTDDAETTATHKVVPDATDAKPKKRKKQKHTSHGDGEAGETSKGKTRFVCFIGNLPYTTTDESLKTHFKKLAPFTLRHRTDPKTKKSKGFAFLEFENYDRMKTCLKLYHHSMFDPTSLDAAEVEEGENTGKAEVKKHKSKAARRINVELTAGGGGKNEDRKEKIKAKNVRLDEQRKRRAEFERIEREKEKTKKGTDGADKKGEEKTGAGEHAGIHPSRLARMKT